MQTLLPLVEPGLLWLGLVAFLAAGTIKGLVGIGLPTTAIGIITLVHEPRAAVALVLLPMVGANAWQVWRMGRILATLRRYAVFAVTLALGVGVTVLVVGAVSDRVLLGIMGVSILVFVATDIALRLPPIPDRLDAAAQAVFGIAAGIMGGLTAVWAPPMVIYLAARHTDKDEFVRATGLLIFVGALPLLWGYARLGYLGGGMAAMSALMLLPTFAGFALGEAARRRLDGARFRGVLLVIFAGFGLNLLRRALFDA